MTDDSYQTMVATYEPDRSTPSCSLSDGVNDDGNANDDASQLDDLINAAGRQRGRRTQTRYGSSPSPTARAPT